MKEDFIILQKSLSVKCEKCVSYSQLKRILRGIDYKEFNKINTSYFSATVDSEGSKWFSLDGKELGGTIAKSSGKKRGISIVNLTDHCNRQSELIGSYDATKASEKPVVNDYLKQSDLSKKKICFDGLHTSVANLKEINLKKGIYLAQLKGNQKQVLKVCQALHRTNSFICHDNRIEQGHGRIEERYHWGYQLDISTLPPKWNDTACCTVIVVSRERYNTKTKKTSKEISYWICNQPLDNETFTEIIQAIRNHWSVEVHHQIRDVQMGEDDLKISNKQEAIVVASFITLAINLLEKQKENISIIREKLTKNWKQVPILLQ